jgi:hypothetical protein
LTSPVNFQCLPFSLNGATENPYDGRDCNSRMLRALQYI